MAFNYREAAWLYILLAIFCITGRVQLLSAQAMDPANLSSVGMSPEMQSAVKLFDEGRDTDAMDQFLEIMTQGNPSERSLANDYLNLIAQRMNVNAPTESLQRPTASEMASRYAPTISQPPANTQQQLPQPQIRQQPQMGQQPQAEEQQKMVQSSVATPTVPDRTRSDIDQRIRSRKRASLEALKDMEGLRLLMADSNNPKAIGIPADLLFDKGVLFRKDAARFMRPFKGLIYTLGAAQVIFLPEGFAMGNSKVLDMRRTMAVTSDLIAGGVAPPRLRVNLLDSQIDFPKTMNDFHGIIALFVYNQPVPLQADHVILEQSGPPVSLGVSPDSFMPGSGDGSLIEFSVSEPPNGIRSWKFRIMPPGYQTAPLELAPIQQVVGSGAVFHQIYWNGRKGYWGKVFPGGRYEAVVSATDSKGRTSVARRWITLENEELPTKSSTTGPKAVTISHRKRKTSGATAHRHKTKPVVPAAAPAENPAPAPTSTAPDANASSDPATSSPANASGTPTKSNQAAPPSAPPDHSADAKNAFSYRIGFVSNTQTMTQEGEQRLAQAADAMGVYPMANLSVVGHAGASETDPNTLAGSRAKAVSSILTSKYAVDPKRITLQSKVGGDSQPGVEIFIVAGKE